jgi:hypothetical protein
MKIHGDFVTNSSSTSYIFVGKDVDSVIREIKERLIFGGYTDQFLSELQKEGFKEVWDKIQLLERVFYITEGWELSRYNPWGTSFSADIHEVINKMDQLDDKIILKVVINYQGDGHDHGCIRDDDWYCRMTKSGSLELVEGIFDDDFMAFFTC